MNGHERCMDSEGWWALPEPRRVEWDAWIENALDIHLPDENICLAEYAVIDAPMLRLHRFVEDEDGWVTDADDRLVKDVKDYLVTDPPPAWWGHQTGPVTAR